MRYPAREGWMGIVLNKDKPSYELCVSVADLVRQGLSITHPRGPWKWAQTAWRSISARRPAMDCGGDDVRPEARRQMRQGFVRSKSPTHDQSHWSSDRGIRCAKQILEATIWTGEGTEGMEGPSKRPSEQVSGQTHKNVRTSPAVWHTERCIHMYTNGRTCRLEMVSTEHCTSCIGLPKFCSGEFPGYLLSVPGLNLRRWGLTIGHEILGSKCHLISEERSMGPSATTGCKT